MIESEIKVTYDKLPENWFKSSFNSIEMVKRTITMINELNGFDLYDLEEDLPEEKAVEKLGLKEHNIMLPLTYDIEVFLKSVIIFYDTSKNDLRENRIKEIFQKVKSQSTIKGNLHNSSIFIDYIQKNIDPNFLEILGLLYVSRRKGYVGGRARCNHYSRNIHYETRLTIATEEFKNAFIDMRYLFEKSDEPRRMDLTKLMDYAESIRDASLYLIMRKKYISLLDEKDTFYDNSEFNDLIGNKVGLNNNNVFYKHKYHQYIAGGDLLKSLSSAFGEYSDRWYDFFEQSSWYISDLFTTELQDPGIHIKKHFENLFGYSDIESLKKLPTNERNRIVQATNDRVESILDRTDEYDKECKQWISKLNGLYLPEYSRNDYKAIENMFNSEPKEGVQDSKEGENRHFYN